MCVERAARHVMNDRIRAGNIKTDIYPQTVHIQSVRVSSKSDMRQIIPAQ